MVPCGFPWVEIPRVSFSWRKRHCFEIVFEPTADSRYTSPDQSDWLKAGGMTLDMGSNNKNALLVGVRYLPNEDEYEIAPYVNFGGGKIDFDFAESNRQALSLDRPIRIRGLVETRGKRTFVSYDFLTSNFNKRFTKYYEKEDLRPKRWIRSVGNFAGGDKLVNNAFSWFQSFTFR